MARAAAPTSTKSMNIFGRPLSIFGVPVDRKIIFADHKGNYKSRIEKRQRKLIVKTTFAKFYFSHEESVRCITTGFSPISVMEQLLTGLAFLFFKRALFIFTNTRILHIPTRFNRSSYSALSQISYADCASIGMKGRTLVITYKNGKTEQFPYIARREKKKLNALLNRIAVKPKAAGKLKQRVYLCPSCTHVLKSDNRTCPTCKLKFKSALQTKIRSILIPGGGYFYTRHPLMGTIVGLLEVGLIGKLVYDVLALNAGQPVNYALMVGLLGAFIAVKAIGTYHALQFIRNFIPVPNEVTMRKI